MTGPYAASLSARVSFACRGVIPALCSSVRCARAGVWLGRKSSACKAFIVSTWDPHLGRLWVAFPLNLIFPFSACPGLSFYLTIVFLASGPTLVPRTERHNIGEMPCKAPEIRLLSILYQSSSHGPLLPPRGGTSWAFPLRHLFVFIRSFKLWHQN